MAVDAIMQSGNFKFDDFLISVIKLIKSCFSEDTSKIVISFKNSLYLEISSSLKCFED